MNSRISGKFILSRNHDDSSLSIIIDIFINLKKSSFESEGLEIISSATGFSSHEVLSTILFVILC